MSRTEVVRVVLASAEALVNTIVALEKRREAQQQLPKLISESKKGIRRMRAYVEILHLKMIRRSPADLRQFTSPSLHRKENFDDVDVIPEQAAKLLTALSRSGLPEDKKNELVEMARKLWKGWKIVPSDIEFVRKRNGDRKRIGSGATAQVYLARMKLRDSNGEIILGEHMEVAVKPFTVKRSEEKKQLTEFIREVFL